LSQSLFFFSGNFVQKDDEGNNGSNEEVDSSLLIDSIETLKESEFGLWGTLSFHIIESLELFISMESAIALSTNIFS